MINLTYYANLLLGEEDAKIVIKIYSKKSFKSINSAKYFFEQENDFNLSWMTNPNAKTRLLNTLKVFAEKLNSQQLDFTEKQEMVLALCDKDASQFSFLEYRGEGMTTTCICPNPSCPDARKNKLSAWIPKKGTVKSVICNHRTNCNFSGDFIKVYATYYGKTYGEAMNLLAQELNIDFTVNEVHVGKKVTKRIEVPVKVNVKVKEIEYMEFDSDRKFLKLEVSEYLDKYDAMTEQQQFKMIATSIYNFSLTTKQWGKEKYFREHGVGVKNKFLTEKLEMIKTLLGYLHAMDIKDLLTHLKKSFPVDDLIKYGVIHPKEHYRSLEFRNDVQEGLIVIPNFDLYTNMCSGLKFRKTKLASWYDKKLKETVTDKNKEPEFSYGRIANPLPYHLTRAMLLDRSSSFRFFEGQKDLHSIPSLKNVFDIAIPGVDGISEEMLGLFNGRKVTLYFDQDKAGQKGALKLKLLLEKAGAIVDIKIWDIKLGEDINEVLQSGNILKIA